VWRRNQHLVSRLLTSDEELRVLFVEPPADPVHDLRSWRRPRFGGRVREHADAQARLWTIQPLKLLPRRLDRGADKRFARAVMRAARELGMTDPLLWINDPAAAEVSRMTGWPTLYDITDDWAVADRSAREQGRVIDGERHLLQHAAQVVACSPELVRRKAGDRGDGLPPIVLIPNGVDTAAYQQAHPRPVDLPEGEIALYAGTLHADRLDVRLCVATAAELGSAVTMVLVGPNALGEADTVALEGRGVVVLGAKAHTELPAYLQHADVLLVAHLVNAFTDSLDPIKLYEYQAAGKPVVSTAVAGFRDAAGVRIVEARADAFAQAIRAAVASPRANAGLSVADADWSVRARSFAQVLSTIRVARGTGGHV
jgi:glycosyltransferase involved in cell wall biosynthesis